MPSSVHLNLSFCLQKEEHKKLLRPRGFLMLSVMEFCRLCTWHTFLPACYFFTTIYVHASVVWFLLWSFFINGYQWLFSVAQHLMHSQHPDMQMLYQHVNTAENIFFQKKIEQYQCNIFYKTCWKWLSLVSGINSYNLYSHRRHL